MFELKTDLKRTKLHMNMTALNCRGYRAHFPPLKLLVVIFSHAVYLGKNMITVKNNGSLYFVCQFDLLRDAFGG